jgi:hypothetical protein
MTRLRAFARANPRQLRGMQGFRPGQEPVPVADDDLKDFQRFVDSELRIRK